MRIAKWVEQDHEQKWPLVSAGREAPRAARPAEKNRTNPNSNATVQRGDDRLVVWICGGYGKV
jgi:hypothetical protein